jgi:hypothetical protein
MSNKKKKKLRRRRARIAADQRSDRMTAADVVARLELVQEDLADLLYEFRYLKRFSELEDVAYVTWRLDTLRAKCDAFVQTGTWDA